MLIFRALGCRKSVGEGLERERRLEAEAKEGERKKKGEKERSEVREEGPGSRVVREI